VRRKGREGGREGEDMWVRDSDGGSIKQIKKKEERREKTKTRSLMK